MLTQHKHLILSAAIMLTSAFTASSQAHADDGLTQARAKVEQKEKSILFCMHPTCTLDSTKYLGKVDGRNQFAYTYYCTGAVGGKWESTMYFSYDERGAITQLDNGSSTTWFGQFAATDLVLDLARDWLKNNESLKKNTLLMNAIDRADAKGILLFLLKYT